MYLSLFIIQCLALWVKMMNTILSLLSRNVMKCSGSRTYKVITIIQLKYFRGYLCQLVLEEHIQFKGLQMFYDNERLNERLFYDNERFSFQRTFLCPLLLALLLFSRKAYNGLFDKKSQIMAKKTIPACTLCNE